MSHTPEHQNDTQDDLPQAFNALGNMLRSGRSFSGHERNCCFLNTRATHDQRFANISVTSGLDFPDDGRAIALVDWDHDGDQDAWVSNRNAPRLRFVRNDTPNQGNFLMIKLRATKQGTNRDAIGARVCVVPQTETKPGPTSASDSGTSMLKTLRAGEGFLSQSSKWLHFGLGKSAKLSSVTVRWPGSSSQPLEKFGPLDANRRYELTQGTGQAQVVEHDRPKLEIEKTAPPTLPTASAQVRLPLVVRLRVPTFSYEALDGESRQLPIGNARHLLINLWSTSCQPCIEELAEFQRRESDLHEAGLDVVTLCVDWLASDSDDETANTKQAMAARMRDRIDQLKLPFPTGLAPRGLVAYLQTLHSYHSPLNRDFPLPSSFLIDADDGLAFIYKGRVTVPQLLRDVRSNPTTPADRFEHAAHFPGSSIRHAVVQRKMKVHELGIRLSLAEGLRTSGQLPLAVAEYRDLLRLEPRLAKAHNNLALTYRQLGRLDEALAGYETALKLEPNAPETYNNLGVALFRQGRIQEARQSYEKAIELKPSYVDAIMNLGTLASRQGDLQQAESCFQQVLELDDGYSKAEFQLGRVAEKRGDLAGAARHYQRAISADPTDVNPYINLGVVMARAGRTQNAIQLLRKAIELQPNSPDAFNNLGIILESEGQLAAARDHFREAIRLDPDNRGFQANLRHLQGLMQRSNESRER